MCDPSQVIRYLPNQILWSCEEYELVIVNFPTVAMPMREPPSIMNSAILVANCPADNRLLGVWRSVMRPTGGIRRRP